MRETDEAYFKLVEQVGYFASLGQPLDAELYDECWEADIDDEVIWNIYNQQEQFNEGEI